MVVDEEAADAFAEACGDCEDCGDCSTVVVVENVSLSSSSSADFVTGAGVFTDSSWPVEDGRAGGLNCGRPEYGPP